MCFPYELLYFLKGNFCLATLCISPSMDTLSLFMHNKLVTCYIQPALLQISESVFLKGSLLLPWMAAAADIHCYMPRFEAGKQYILALSKALKKSEHLLSVRLLVYKTSTVVARRRVNNKRMNSLWKDLSVSCNGYLVKKCSFGLGTQNLACLHV